MSEADPERILRTFPFDSVSACDALYRLAISHVGVRLFTLMEFDSSRGEGRRFYSNMPDLYPLSGRKQVPAGIWLDSVITNRSIFVANRIEDIAEVFPDHELIKSLGCGAVINIPVWNDDGVIGTINCLDKDGAYGPARVAAAADLRLPGTLCFLIEQSRSSTGGAP